MRETVTRRRRARTGRSLRAAVPPRSWLVALVWGGLLAVAGPSAQAAPGAGDTAGWRTLAPGLSHRLFVPPADQVEASFTLEAFRVDLRQLRPVIADARRPAQGRQVATVRELARERKALLAVNGSFFDERLRPLGLLVESGRIIRPLRRADWGVLYVQGTRARLQHTRVFGAQGPAPSSLDFAIQVGPRLVSEGKPLRLKRQWAERAAIGILADGALVVVVSRGGRVESNDLARLMAAPRAAGGLGCSDALMMDGGPSAQLFAGAGDFQLDRPGAYGVPIAVAFVKR